MMKQVLIVYYKYLDLYLKEDSNEKTIIWNI